MPVDVAWSHIRCQEGLSLSKMSVPSLFIAGGKDVMMSPEKVEENSKLVPGAKFVVIPKMGHMFFNREIEEQIGNILLNHFGKKIIS